MVTMALEILQAQVEPDAVAARLRLAMRGRSQYRIVRTSGVAARIVGRCLRGECKQGPTLETLVKLAHACEVSPGWLAFGVGDGP